MAQRMVGFLKWASPGEEVWINPWHVVLVHQPGEGATLEFVEGKAVTVAGTPARVAAALAGELESEERVGKAEPDGATASDETPITKDDEVTGDFVQARRVAEVKIAELALGAIEGGADAIPDSIFTSFPVEIGLLIAEETIHLIDAFEGALMSRDLESPAKVQLVAALQDHAGGVGSVTGERRFWALSAVEKVQRMTDQQCEWLRGWVYGWYDGTGEPEDDPDGEP